MNDYPILEDWYLSEDDASGQFLAHGHIHESPRFLDGKHIRTSPLYRIYERDGQCLVRTRNSVYRLGRRRLLCDLWTLREAFEAFDAAALLPAALVPTHLPEETDDPLAALLWRYLRAGTVPTDIPADGLEEDGSALIAVWDPTQHTGLPRLTGLIVSMENGQLSAIFETGPASRSLYFTEDVPPRVIDLEHHAPSDDLIVTVQDEGTHILVETNVPLTLHLFDRMGRRLAQTETADGTGFVLP
ncbi:MAG: hypothetical protein IKI21_02635 [Oscillospiraceae bacterium]|nr:hypothetical protein [Oscillospiraceae bacterium]